MKFISLLLHVALKQMSMTVSIYQNRTFHEVQKPWFKVLKTIEDLKPQRQEFKYANCFVNLRKISNRAHIFNRF